MSRANPLHVFGVLEHDRRHRRSDHPWHDGIDADAERSEFQCHRLGDPHDPVLRRGIGEAVGHAPDPGRRAEVHDCRLCLRFLYGTGESLAHVERAFEVDRQDLPPNLGIGIQNVADSPDAGAVDQPMEFSEPSNRSGQERGDLVPVRNVNADAIDPFAVPEFGHDLIDLFFPHVCGDDRRAFCE